MSSQTQKDYSGDWAKAKSRDMLREMISKLPKAQHYSHKMNVLFLPGVDAAEVFQVYDQLGIPRENLTGIEREKDVYEELRRKNLGIQLVHSSLEDYIASEKKFNFDVLSFDFVGPTTSSQREGLLDVLHKSTSGDIVLHVANQIRRDGCVSKTNYVTGDLLSRNDNIVSMLDMEDEKFLDKIVDFMNGTEVDYNSGFNINKRGDCFTQLLVQSSNLAGDSHSYLKRLYEFSTGNSLDDFLKELKENSQDEELNKLSYEEMTSNYLIASAIQKFSISALRAFLSRNVHNINETGINMGSIAIASSISNFRRYFSLDIKRYSYVSESGSPMLGDILHYRYPEQLINSAKLFSRSLRFPKKLQIADRKKASQFLIQYHKTFKEYETKITFDSTNLPERTFLGNSARPVLTKQRAIEELKKGMSIDEIKAKYRGVNGKPLSQWKAHVTMGTYGEKPAFAEADRIIFDADDSDLEKITKEDALDLLSSEIPINEILESYPTSFTDYQLRGLKASLTRKNKQKENENE